MKAMRVGAHGDGLFSVLDEESTIHRINAIGGKLTMDGVIHFGGLLLFHFQTITQCHNNKETEGVRITDMLCGYGHTIALASTGTCLSWGVNYHGELGLGHAEDERVETPQRIAQLPKVCC